MSSLIVASLLFAWFGRWRQSLVDFKGLARYHIVHITGTRFIIAKHAVSMHTSIHLPFSIPKFYYA